MPWWADWKCTNYCQNKDVSAEERQKYYYCWEKKNSGNTWLCFHWYSGLYARRFESIHQQENCNREGLSATYISYIFYTFLHQFLLLNVDPNEIKVNKSALEEIVRTREESLFSWQHPWIELNVTTICIFNIRSRNGNLKHFFSDRIYSTYSRLSCFTETNIIESPAKHIDELLNDWKDIHKNTKHGLTVLQLEYNINEVINIPSVLETCQLYWKSKRRLWYW